MAIKTGSQTVATAGTRVQLTATARIVNKVTLQAKGANGTTALVFVGDSTVSSSNGIELSAGQAVVIEGAAIDLSTIYIDADTNGVGVKYLYDE